MQGEMHTPPIPAFRLICSHVNPFDPLPRLQCQASPSFTVASACRPALGPVRPAVSPTASPALRRRRAAILQQLNALNCLGDVMGPSAWSGAAGTDLLQLEPAALDRI